MLSNPQRVRSLIGEYGRMVGLAGFTPQSRGQRLNGLIAEMLECWGIHAEEGIRSHGEIDVAFDLGGRHFIIEAKWEDARTGTGALAKLQKRLRQRLGGTVGVFLSMAGYTPEGLADLKDGEPLNVICLDREHFEAMLSGFVPPAELLEQSVRNASWRGEAFTRITDLFPAPSQDAAGPGTADTSEIGQLVSQSVSGFDARALMSDIPAKPAGVTELAPDRLLLTTDKGLCVADVSARQIEPWPDFAHLPDCSGNPLVLADGSVFVVRRSGVARVRGREVSFVGGAGRQRVPIFGG